MWDTINIIIHEGGWFYMKKYLIYCSMCGLCLLFAVNSFAFSNDFMTSSEIKTNLVFSPISYNKFLGTLVNDDEYDFKDQFSEAPFKRIGIEVTRSYVGFVLYFTHNRFSASIDPCGESYFDKEKISITSYILGVTFQRPIDFISRNFIFKFDLGFSSIDIWKKELKENGRKLGVYFDAGLRYVFPSDSNYKLNVGVDLSHSESFVNYSDNCYDFDVG